MKPVILDTNFIITCVKQKIDFMQEIEFMGLQAIVPEQVIKELERLSEKKQEAKLALKVLHSGFFTKKKIGKKYADKAIIQYAKSNSEAIIATLDSDLKRKIKNNKLVIRGKKRLEII